MRACGAHCAGGTHRAGRAALALRTCGAHCAGGAALSHRACGTHRTCGAAFSARACRAHRTHRAHRTCRACRARRAGRGAPSAHFDRTADAGHIAASVRAASSGGNELTGGAAAAAGGCTAISPIKAHETSSICPFFGRSAPKYYAAPSQTARGPAAANPRGVFSDLTGGSRVFYDERRGPGTAAPAGGRPPGRGVRTSGASAFRAEGERAIPKER